MKKLIILSICLLGLCSISNAKTLKSKPIVTQIKLNLTGPGAKLDEFQHFRQNFPIKVGQRLFIKKYNQAKQDFFLIAANHGYLDAKLMKHEIIISPQNKAKIILEFATGKRYYFGKIKLKTGPFSQRFVKRYITFKSGQPYSNKKIAMLQQALSNSGYFKTVTIKSEKTKQHQHIPINIILTPVKAQRYIFGAGFGTDTGFRGTLGWNWRRVNSLGNKFQTKLKLSQVQNQLSARYIIPGDNPIKDEYSVFLNGQTTRVNVGRNSLINAGVDIKKQLGRWLQNLALSIQSEVFKIKNQSQQTVSMLLPSASWLYLNKDNALFNLNGYKFYTKLQGAPQIGFLNLNFFQVQTTAKYIHTFKQTHTRFITRGEFGATAVQDIQRLPLSLRFVAGGSQSLRGYNYQSIGPGKYLKVASVELQQQVIPKWYAATFFDAGTASNDLSHSLDKGAGVGVVFASPLGPIELTIAQALTRPGHPYRIQFIMGPDL